MPPSAWDGRWGEAPARVEGLYASAATAVYRVEGRLAGERRYILKLSHNPGAVEREAEVWERVVRRLPIPAPRVLAHSAATAPAFIAYADDGLRPLRKTAGGLDRVLRAMAELHQFDPRRLDLPAAAASHTPEASAVAAEVRSSYGGGAGDFAWFAELASPGELAAPVDYGAAIAAVRRFLDEAIRPQDAWSAAEPVLCHGDLHIGNAMVSARDRRLYIIDWEFLHVDSPYFDLFQLLDATSPHTPLPRIGARLRALGAYGRFCGQRPEDARAFQRGCILFSGLHLFWILLRIRGDLAAKRFSRRAMRRQLRETLAGLLSLREDLESLR